MSRSARSSFLFLSAALLFLSPQPGVTAALLLAADPPPALDDWAAEARAGIRSSEYHFRLGDGGSWTAPNRALDLRVNVGPGGTLLSSRTDPGSFEVRFRLEGVGRRTARPVLPADLVRASEGTVELLHDGLMEWLANSPGGLEHGFLLQQAPTAGPGSVVLTVRVAVSPGRLVGAASAPLTILDGTGTPLLTYDHLRVTDAAGRPLHAEMVAGSGRIEIRFDDEDALYPIRIDPVIGRPSWTYHADPEGEEPALRVAPAGDVDGDGFADVLVGVPGFDGVAASTGAVFLFTGSPAGLSPRPHGAWHGEISGGRLGSAVSLAGDVNGDGKVDLLAGSRGRVSVYLGSPAGFRPAPSWSAEQGTPEDGFGTVVSAAGDVNSDGYDDFLVGAPSLAGELPGEGVVFLYVGSSRGPRDLPAWTARGEQAGARFGCALAAAGDVDGDGFDDLLVGADAWDGTFRDEGAASLFLGGRESPSLGWRLAGGQEASALGASVAGAGDLNGDGYDDIVVAAPLLDARHLDEGRLLVFLGSRNGPEAQPDWTAQGDQPGARLGASVSPAGDTDGDGFDDLIAGAPGFDDAGINEGRALIFSGSPSGLGALPAWSVEGRTEFESVGWAVGAAGDVNGDGRDDVIVGRRSPGRGEGHADSLALYTATRGVLDALPAWTADGGQDEALFGTFVSSAGDVDGDGYDDILVGAMFYDDGEVDEGRVFLYPGSASGPSPVPSWSAEGNQESAAFGASLSAAGDVNGDGFDDVVIGAYLYDGGEENEGRLYLYLGSPAGLGRDPAWTWEPDQAMSRLGVSGGSVAAAGDVNGDGLDDVIAGAAGYDAGQQDEGRAYVFLGSPGGLRAGPSWVGESNQAGARYGASVAGAGDVNGDGFDDIIVGAPAYDGGQNNEGQVYLYLGSPDGPASGPAWTAQSQQAKALYGASVSGAGDINGDGFDDFLIGVPAFDDPRAAAGRTDLFLGGTGGPASAADWTATGRQEGAFFGISVSGAGDVDGDGFDDFLVGARFHDDRYADEGSAFLYRGTADGPSALPDWQVNGGQRGATLGAVVNRAGDVNGDGLDDVVIGARYHDSARPDEGQARVYLGSRSSLTPRNAP